MKTPRTDSMIATVKGMGEVARARNIAFLCRTLERELRRVGMALDEQNERWGIYGNEGKQILKEFKRLNPDHTNE